MNEPGDVRVSDQQRERTAQDIREHYAAGRLTDDELNQRVDAVYRAQTEDQLRALRGDLPALPPSPAQQKAALVARRGQLQRRLIQQTGGGLGLFVLCTIIWLMSGAHGQFWPVWLAVVSVIPLLRNGWRLYGPDPELDRVEQELVRREQHLDRRAARRSRHRAR